MSIADVEFEILGPMQRLFLPPRNMDEGQQTQALREYGDALQAFGREDLRQSWVTVRNSHQNRSWPVPGAFINAAIAARKERSPGGGESMRDKKAKEQAERWNRWLEIRKSPLARQAVERGVSWSMKCAVLDGKKAEEIDLRELVIHKASAERKAAMIERDEPIEWKGQTLRFDERHAGLALRMWRNIQAQEVETQTEIQQAAA